MDSPSPHVPHLMPAAAPQVGVAGASAGAHCGTQWQRVRLARAAKGRNHQAHQLAGLSVKCRCRERVHVQCTATAGSRTAPERTSEAILFLFETQSWSFCSVVIIGVRGRILAWLPAWTVAGLAAAWDVIRLASKGVAHQLRHCLLLPSNICRRRGPLRGRWGDGHRGWRSARGLWRPRPLC